MQYETVIGLEIHAELATKSKIFCACENAFGGAPNTRTCPVCTGMPGALPVLNKQAVELAAKAGIALNCEISPVSRCDRKNYFYPDLPKAYQISQADAPLCRNGYLDITVNNETKRIAIARIHIEEDAGKLVHEGHGDFSMADYNRCGVPLIEIVTEPDLRSPEEAYAFLETLKSVLEYTGVSDCKMQEGSLRCDVNVSLRPVGEQALGTRCEMKNVNSFRGAVRAMEYEAARQEAILKQGKAVLQETRRWDDAKGESVLLRSKEDAKDYRFFPEPDLPPFVVSKEWIAQIRSALPELPGARKRRYMQDFGLTAYDADILAASLALSDFFESAVAAGANPKAAANRLMGDVAAILNEKTLTASDIPFTPKQLAKLLLLVEDGTISTGAAKKVIAAMFDNPKDPEIYVKKLGLSQVSDSRQLTEWVSEVLKNNPQSILDYKAGKQRAKGFLIGQIMKLSRGKGNPQMIERILSERLGEIEN